MVPPDARRLLVLSGSVLAGSLIGLPWATGGRSPAGQAALVLLLAVAGATGLLPRHSDNPGRISFPLLFGGILVAASALLTIYPDRTIQTLLLLLAYVIAGGVATRVVAQVSWAERALLDAIWLSGLVVAVPAIVGLVQGNSGGIYANVLIGPFGYPNAMGGFLLLTGGAALASLVSGGRHLERAGAVLGAAVSVLGIYLTRSRGVLLAAVAGLLLWAVARRDSWWPRRPMWRVVVTLGLLGGLILLGSRLAGILGAFWPGMVGAPGDTSIGWRFHILGWTWAMVRDHPWLGVGPGAFPVALMHYQQIPYVSGENPHNLYLEVAAEYGLVAGILFSAGLILFLGRTVRAARRLPEGSPSRGRQAALAGTMAAFALHSVFDLDWSFPAIALTVATILGMASARVAGFRMPVIPRSGVPLPRTLLILLLVGAAAVSASRYYATSLVAWGRSDLAAGDLSSARQYLEEARRLNPLGYAVNRWLAWTTLRSGDPQKAIEIAERTIGIAPQDPNGHALTGEIALAGRRWQIAQTAFERAIDQAPMAYLKYHAGLLEAASRSDHQAEATHVYEQTLFTFTPQRVLDSEARCLAPGDRYLLARMSRTAARLYEGSANPAGRQDAIGRAALLSQPDLRGICTTGGPPGHTSPESAVANFWRAWSEGGWLQAKQFLLLERNAHEPQEAPRQVRLTSIYALDGGERLATLWHEVEIDDGKVRTNRCAQAVTRFAGEGWFLEGFPAIWEGPCQSQD